MQARVIVSLSVLILSLCAVYPAAAQVAAYYYSVDIGSDLEMSDPNTPGFLDPGDIYTVSAGEQPVKDDFIIDGVVDPPPPPAVPVGLGSIDDYPLYFDMDGEDQLEYDVFENWNEGLLVVTASTVNCLWKNPDDLYISFEDDGAPGWPQADVPVTTPPAHGGSIFRDEILSGTVWRVWFPLVGVADEASLGLAPNPDFLPDEEQFDDDVDALDVELCEWWFWTADHEAYGSGGWTVDPGAIYRTHRVAGGYSIAVSQYALGIGAYMDNGTNVDADVDAFEFCTTDDTNVTVHFQGTIPGQEYMAVLFSVDQDDPLTPAVDESGRLKPTVVYISLLNGDPPLGLVDYDGEEEDIDALAVMDFEEYEKELCPKWIQPPDCDIGLDVESLGLYDPMPGEPLIADDWLCDGRPITAIQWWGSYIGYETNNPSSIPPPTAAPDRPIGFRIGWYLDIPATTEQHSRPGALITNQYVSLSSYGVYQTGMVYELTQCVSHLTFIGEEVYEHEYSYYVELENDWNEKNTNIYWLSVQAVYGGQYPDYKWGWKTTPVQYNWNDAAVFDANPDPLLRDWMPMVYPPYGWSIPDHPYEGQPVNLSFKLWTDICPARCTKWSQGPDMEFGTDMLSMYTNGEPNIIRADDFISDGRPITDIHWWGSYINYEYWHPAGVTNPMPPPSMYPVTGFYLSWHENDGSTCLPGTLLTNIWVSISNCHEVYYGSVEQFWIEPGWYEHEYQYYVDLLDPEIAGYGAWLETNTGHYWLNIQATMDPAWQPGEEHFGWGWKITPQPEECFSAISYDGGVVWTQELMNPPHPYMGQNYDLSFELTTTNIPWASGSRGYVAFTDEYYVAVSDWMITTGRCACGKQILQTATNLKNHPVSWTDVATNPVPMPRNVWTDLPAGDRRYYRVKMVP